MFCNLLRGVVPGLIAATGHAGLGERGASRTGSRRFAESTEHYATRYLASVSPLHLARVAQCLRREEGVQRLELMDVNPRGGGSGELSSVELRFVDAQMLLPTVRAMALAFQALAIRARRTVREGRRVGAISQMLLMFLKSLPPNAPPRARVAGLVKFQERAGTTDLDAALKRFDREQAREFRRLLRPARELRHWIGAEEIGADTPRGLPVRAADLARRHGLALVDFHLPAAREADAHAAERRLIETTPPDLVAFALQRVRFEKDGR